MANLVVKADRDGGLKPVTGPLPAALAPHVEPFAGQVLPIGAEIDSDEFTRHVEAETRRQSQPAPERPRYLTRAEIVRDLFATDGAAFDAATGLGFPRSDGMRMNSKGVPESMWRERLIHEWAERIGVVGAALSR